MKTKSLLAAMLAFVMVLGIPLNISGATNSSNIILYKANYDPEQYPQENLDVAFTSAEITVDGIADEAYAAAQSAMIDNVKPLENYNAENGTDTYGTLKTLWDGPVLYILVEVHDLSTQRPAADSTAGAQTSKPAVPSSSDCVVIGLDLYNDKVVYETDTIGAFTIGSDGQLYFYRNSGIPSLGSCMADPIHPEYQNRIKDYASADIVDPETEEIIGYTVEVAIQIEGLELTNGTKLGLETNIIDYKNMEVFWSHDQDSLYSKLDHERPNSVDWGNLTLTGWTDEEFAYSNWRLTNAIRYLDSIAFPKDVYTEASQAELNAARVEAQSVLFSAQNYQEDKVAADAAADRLENAIRGLRWADTRYPDPDELPDQMTLPNPYKFFGSERMVENNEDWQDRREQILDMAQFYEYGYKPGAPDSMEIIDVKHYNVGDMITIVWGPWSWDIPVTTAFDEITIAITVGETTSNLKFSIYSPTDEQLEASGHTDGPIPMILSFDGDNEVYRDAGFAVVSVPAGSSGDIRSNEYAWGTRSGTFYELYPYSRNGEGALKEVSSEMAAAWSATRVIDALEEISASEEETLAAIGSNLDPSRLAVTGFSINGKYAFVSAVFDERIDVCIPGAAGATGPSPWRYVYTGQVHDWTDTIFAPADPEKAVQVAFGTEFMANSVRHNRVRETELFRQFLTPNNFYKRLPGAYGYGTRLPFDQNDLVATLAPRAIVLENTVNDYNDGCVADSLSLQIAKSVYNNLGYDADALIKFNQRPVVPSGDPHGSDNSQRARTAEYLNAYFYGDESSEITLSDVSSSWLDTDPFTLPISNNRTQSPYDYYYGGYNTITGGTGGVDGRDGWYYYSFPDYLNLEELQALYDQLIDTDLSSYTETSAEAFRLVLQEVETLLEQRMLDTEENRKILESSITQLQVAYEQLALVEPAPTSTTGAVTTTPTVTETEMATDGAELPVTGENSTASIWFAILAACLIILVSTRIVYSKKRPNK